MKGNGVVEITLGFVEKIPYPGQQFTQTIEDRDSISTIYRTMLDNEKNIYINVAEKVDDKNVISEVLYSKIIDVSPIQDKEGIECTFEVLSISKPNDASNSDSGNVDHETFKSRLTDIKTRVINEDDEDDDDIEEDDLFKALMYDDNDDDEGEKKSGCSDCGGSCDDEVNGLFDKMADEEFSHNKPNNNSSSKETFYQKYKKTHGGNSELSKYINFVNNLDASDEIREAIADEIYHLSNERKQSGDYSTCVNWLETVMALPWNVPYSGNFSMPVATDIIEKSHYGMKDVKDRIIELLAVRKKNNTNNGAIICLVGPPGVGKTSIARSIAEALGKKFARFSISSLHDETDIVGHRRTYVGSCPGKLIQSLKIAHSRDPVLLLDEIDKAPQTGSLPALLEVLDPEQNKNFQDVYLDFPFDLSKVVFVITANDLSSVPAPLLDRMEVLEISGYTENEKVHIATDYLIPKQLEKNGIAKDELNITKGAIQKIISGYTAEAGVRNLERSISKIIRKYVRSEITGDKVIDGNTVTEKNVDKFLGVPYFDKDNIIKAEIPGSSLGLSVSTIGVGSVLQVDIQATPGKGMLALTGKLGEVIKESATVAFTWLKKHFAGDENYAKFFDFNDFHLHLPEGATSKDGPSAGIAFAVAFYSLYTNMITRPNLAMTGEINLLGEVTAIGGLKEKILGAKRNKVTDIIIPKQNMRDVAEMDKEILENVTLHPVSRIEEALEIAFPKTKTSNTKKSNKIKTLKNAEIMSDKPCIKKDANCSHQQEI